MIYVAVFGVIYTMSMIPFAVFDGGGNAISTVVSILVGERDAEGIITVLRQGIKVVSISGAVVSLLFLLEAESIFKIFGFEAGESFQTSIPAFWQAIGRAKLASMMSIIRNFLLMLILGFVLISNYQIIGLSISYLASEVICFLIVVSVMVFKGSKAFVREEHGSKESVYEKYYTIQAESIAQVSVDLENLCQGWEINFNKRIFSI